MSDSEKSKDQLCNELATLRRQLATMERKQQHMAAALRESRERFDLFMKHIPAAVFIKNCNQELVYANPQFAEIIGCEPPDITDQTSGSFTSDTVLSQFEEENQIVLSTGQTLRAESTFPTASGLTHWLTYKFPIYKEGRPAFVGGISLEITDRKQMEKAFRQANTDLHHRLEELTTLNLIAQTLATVTDLAEVLDIATTTVTWLFDSYGTGLSLLNADQSEIIMFAHYQLDDALQETLDLSFTIPPESLIHQVIKKGQSIVLSMPQSDPWLDSSRKFMAIPERCCLMLVPLVVRGNVTGIIEVASDEAGRQFTRTEVTLAETIAGQVAGAVEVARLFEEVRQDAIAKTQLLKEVNHRVRNNLMAINGLILAEKQYVSPEGVAAAVLERLNQRVHGLIQAHNILSKSGWTTVSLSTLVREIIRVVLAAWPSQQQVRVEVGQTEIEVSPRQASNLVLIINELVTNTLKHALPTVAEKGTVQITVQCTLENGWISLEYRDNGAGYPDTILETDQNQKDDRSLSSETETQFHIGLHLIRQIVTRTLRGRVRLTRNNGAVTKIFFRSETEAGNGKL